MAGYIGSKAVTLSTTAADVTGNAIINGDLTVKGTTLTVDSAAAQEIRLGDNDKMTFGDATGGDLQIYHSGSASWVKNTGDLILQGNGVRLFNNSADVVADFGSSGVGSAAARLFFAGNGEKLATTSTGVDITGVTNIDTTGTSGGGKLRVGGLIDITATSGGAAFRIFDGVTFRGGLGDGNWTGTGDVGDFGIYVGSSSKKMPIHIGSANPIAAFTSTGLGIGDLDPLDKLEVKTTTLGGITISSPTHNYAALSFARSSTATARIFISEPGALHTSAIHLQTSNASGGPNLITAMTIDQNQNVGIGTSSPSETLDVSGNIRALGANSRVMFGPDGFEAGIKYATDASLQIASRTGENITFNNGNDGSERMRIRSDGIVTINDSTDPTAGGFAPKLHVKQGGDGIFGGFTIEGHNSDVVGGMGYSASSDTFGIGASYRSTAGFKPLAFLTSNSERLRIDTSGNTLFGKTSVSWTLDGTQIENGGETLGVTSSLTGNNFFARKNNATGTMFAFWYNSTNIGNITSGTSSVAYNTSSDYRLKENVTDVTDGITRIKQLAPKRFNFIADPDTTVDGFIAHEAQAVVPEAVTGTHNAVDADGNPEYQGIDQSKLVPLLTAALQEAIAKIETLETEMTSVKARLDALEAE